MTNEQKDELIKLLVKHTFGVWEQESTSYGLTDYECKKLEILFSHLAGEDWFDEMMVEYGIDDDSFKLDL